MADLRCMAAIPLLDGDGEQQARAPHLVSPDALIPERPAFSIDCSAGGAKHGPVRAISSGGRSGASQDDGIVPVVDGHHVENGFVADVAGVIPRPLAEGPSARRFLGSTNPSSTISAWREWEGRPAPG